MVQLNPDGSLSLAHRRIFEKSAKSFSAYLDENDLHLIRLLESCNQENIIRQFYPKPIRPSEFFPRKYTEELRTSIRLYIEDKLNEALLLMKDKLVFVMGNEGNPAAFPIKIAEEPCSVLFHFRRNTDGTRYFPTLKYKGQRIEFMFKNALIVSNQPAWMLLNGILHYFENDIEGKKLLPFINKRFIEISPSAEDNYFEKFVAPLIEKHHVYAEGFEIKNEKYTATSLLTLQPDILGQPLQLSFSYGEYTFPFDTNANISASVEKIADKYIVHRIKRAHQWEQNQLNKLLDLGLQFQSPNYLFAQSYTQLAEGEEINYATFDWLNEYSFALEEMGFTINISENTKKYVIGKNKINLKFSEHNDWFDVYAMVQFGSFQIPFLELKQSILQRKKEFTLPNGQIAIIPDSWFVKYTDLFALGEGNNELKLKKHHVGLIKDLTESGISETILSRRLQKLQDVDTIEDYTIPENFKGELRSYQKAGYNWFNFLREFNFGGCLADDMGLGKTIQTLALLQKVKEENKDRLTSLIIMPTSLIYNWQAEAKKFTPKLKVGTYLGSERIKEAAQFAAYDVVLTTYGIARVDAELLQTFYFHYLILDESQNIKNPQSKSAKTVKSLKSKYKLVLSGTPVENTIGDLWSQLSFVNPGLLGSFTYFQKEFIIPIEKKQDPLKLQRLQALIKPFVLRRTKDQVASELPPKSEQVFYCNMTEEQEKLYDETKSYYRNELLQLIASNGSGKHALPILQGLTKLRLIANHPKMVKEEYKHDSWKFNLILELLENTLAKGHKILVFSQFVKHLTLLKDALDKKEIRYSYLDGATRDRQQAIQQFREEEDTRLFLISLKAGGTGLNLTEADYVFMLDPWWNPAAEQQAIDRAHRIGQKKNVFIYKFITKNTVEEKILALQGKKKDLAGSLITTEESYAKTLSREDIEELLR